MSIPFKYRVFTFLSILFIASIVVLTEIYSLFFWLVVVLALVILGYMSYLLRPVKSKKEKKLSKPPFISIIVPVKDEERVIEDLIKDVLSQTYQKYELIIVDDFSKDRTFEIIKLYEKNYSPKIRVIRKRKGFPSGKASSLNLATKSAKGDWLLVLDADSRIKKNFLEIATKHLSNEELVAAQVAKMISNRRRNWLTRQQYNEFLIDYSVQLGKEESQGCVELKGNGSFIKKDFLEKTNGWDTTSIAEDLELSTRIITKGKKIKFIKDAAVYEQAVTNIKDLFHQRTRWIEGSLLRYLKYLPFLFSRRIPLKKKIDFVFFASEFMVPLWVFFDIFYQFFRVATGKSLKFLNLSVILSILSVVMISQMIRGFVLRKMKKPFFLIKNSFSTALYLLHWFPVVVYTAFHVIFSRRQKKWRIARRS